MMNSPSVEYISECFVQPHYASKESKQQPFYLNQGDLLMLSGRYIQRGLLFAKPPEAMNDHKADFISALLEKLKHSLSLALVHFYPLAGRLATKKQENPPLYLVYVDCSKSPGARFIYATLDMSVSDILAPINQVTLVVQSFFDHNEAVNHDGHTMSLLTVQVTELLDGIFIGLSMNHCLADGTSYWHFFNTWSELFQAQTHGHERHITPNISHPPILKRWFPDGHGPIISLPYTHPDEFIGRFEAPKLSKKIFHFSAESIAKLKAKANAEHNNTTNTISSFQSLCALVWRCITRARDPPPSQVTTCILAADNRSRLVSDPPLSQYNSGNFVAGVRACSTTSELVLEQHGLALAASKLHEAVVNHNDEVIRRRLDAWFQSPTVSQMGQYLDPYTVIIGSSPRFSMYGNEFGMGKALAMRSGYGEQFDGKVSAHPGRQGGGSIDLDVYLSPEAMSALLCDKEFMEAASS